MDVLPTDDRDRILAGGEELRHRSPVQTVAFVLEVAQGVKLTAGVLEALQPADRLVKLLGAAKNHLRLVLRLGPDLADAVAGHVPGGLVDMVANVVDRAG